MNDLVALWAACIANPLSETPRLVLADWLDDNGSGRGAANMRNFGGRLLVWMESRRTNGNNLMKKVVGMDAEGVNDFIWDSIESSAHEFVGESINDLTESDEVTSETAMTNASGFSVDEHEMHIGEVTADSLTAVVTFTVSGEVDEDRVYSGRRVNGSATVTIRADEFSDRPNNPFEVEYTKINAERDLEMDEDDEGYDSPDDY